MNVETQYVLITIAMNYSHKIASNHMNYAFKDNVWQHIAALIICPARVLRQPSLSPCVLGHAAASPQSDLHPQGPGAH